MTCAPSVSGPPMSEFALDEHPNVDCGIVTFAHAAMLPPFAEQTPQGSRGIAVDILLEAAKRAGLSVKILALPFEELHTAVSTGVASAIFPIGISAERKKLFDFSDPLIMTGGGLFTKIVHGAEMPTLEALSGKVVTTPITGPLFDIIKENSPNIRLLPSANYEESFQQLIDGRAEAAALNFHVGRAMIEQRFAGLVRAPLSTFVDLPMAVAASRNEKRWLIEILNLSLRQIRSEGTQEKAVVYTEN